MEGIKIRNLDPAAALALEDLIVLAQADGRTRKATIEQLRTIIGSVAAPASPAFDSDRPVLRVPQVGDVIGGDSLLDFANFFYFAAPTLALTTTPNTQIFEWGTVNSIDINTNTQNPGLATLASGRVNVNGSQIFAFGATNISSNGFVFQPGASGGNNAETYAFQAFQDYTGAENGTVQSAIRTIKGIYPILSGVSSVDLHAGGNAFSELTKSVQDQGNITRTLDGTGFLYFAFPTTWSISNLASIIDPNGFNVTASFEVQTVSVTSSGNDNDWTQDYRVYKLQTQTTADNAPYIFND